MKYAKEFACEYREYIRKFIPSPTLNLVAKKICERIEKDVGKNGKVLVAGCGKGGEGISGFSNEFLRKNVFGLDIRETEFTDVIGDIHDMPFDDETFDAVICQSTLEHIRNVDTALDEIDRVLVDKGYLYLDVPFLQGYHALPTDFRRYTAMGVGKDLLSDHKFETLENGVSKGPTSTVVWIACEYIAFILCLGNSKARKVVSVSLRCSLFWLKYVDIVLLYTHGLDKKSMPIPSAVYWYGKIR